ncbi:hypothetical protein DFH09DRAFT_1088217 [Mycena vulgaris]|nr:hypothetical protein DFH09DRAFT_1088217 [Mycena vulgaris]
MSETTEIETQAVAVVAPKKQKKLKPTWKQVKPGDVVKTEAPQTGKEYTKSFYPYPRIQQAREHTKPIEIVNPTELGHVTVSTTWFEKFTKWIAQEVWELEIPAGIPPSIPAAHRPSLGGARNLLGQAALGFSVRKWMADQIQPARPPSSSTSHRDILAPSPFFSWRRLKLTHVPLAVAVGGDVPGSSFVRCGNEFMHPNGKRFFYRFPASPPTSASGISPSLVPLGAPAAPTPSSSVPSAKPKYRCPKCGSTRINPEVIQNTHRIGLHRKSSADLSLDFRCFKDLKKYKDQHHGKHMETNA